MASGAVFPDPNMKRTTSGTNYGTTKYAWCVEVFFCCFPDL